jgi:flagellum-specific ATP synthase
LLLAEACERVRLGPGLLLQGTLMRLSGLVLEATGLRAPVGAQCLVSMADQPPVLTEVVGFSGHRAFLMPAGDVHGLANGARVEPLGAVAMPLRLGQPFIYCAGLRGVGGSGAGCGSRGAGGWKATQLS